MVREEDAPHKVDDALTRGETRHELRPPAAVSVRLAAAAAPALRSMIPPSRRQQDRIFIAPRPDPHSSLTISEGAFSSLGGDSETIHSDPIVCSYRPTRKWLAILSKNPYWPQGRMIRGSLSSIGESPKSSLPPKITSYKLKLITKLLNNILL